MRRRWFLAGLAAAIATVGVSADARMHAPYRGHRIIPANAAPLDGFTTPSGAYSFRKLRSTYAGPAVKLQRVDTTTSDIGFTATGDFDTAAATAFCTTACTVTTWYDQSGNARHLTQSTAANQPAYVANCSGRLPCLRVTSGTITLATTGSTTPATGKMSFSAVGNRSAGTAQCYWLIGNFGGTSNRITSANAAAQWSVLDGTLGVNGAAANAAWHAATGALNAAASYINIDGAVASGTTNSNNVAAGTGVITGTAATTCDESEAVRWDNYILTAPEAAALVANQRGYWAALPLDMLTQPSGAYGMRKLLSGYAGSAIRLRRASDQAELDIGFVGYVPGLGSPVDVAAANAHCASTTCFGSKWYDQSGNARDLVQATAANQPQLIFNCQGTLPCWQYTANTQVLQASATITPATGTVSFSAVGQRSGGIGSFSLISENAAAGNRVAMAGTTDTWGVFGGSSGNVTAAGATEGAWHALNAVLAGASSVISIDGVETTGTATGSVTAALPRITGAPSPTIANEVEAVFWDNYSLTPAERAVLVNNQRGFWGF
jgi:hypothetical protein